MTENCLNYLFFNTESDKGEIGLYFENNEKKILGGATSQKSQKRIVKTMIFPLAFRLGFQKMQYDPLNFI